MSAAHGPAAKPLAEATVQDELDQTRHALQRRLVQGQRLLDSLDDLEARLTELGHYTRPAFHVEPTRFERFKRWLGL